MEVVGLAAGRSAEALLAKQAHEFKPRAVALYDTTELEFDARATSGRASPVTAARKA